MAGAQVYVPLTIAHAGNKTLKLQLKVEAPKGWKVTSGEGEIVLPAEATSEMRVEVETPRWQRVNRPRTARRKSSYTRKQMEHPQATSSSACYCGLTVYRSKLLFRAPGFQLLPGVVGSMPKSLNSPAPRNH